MVIDLARNAEVALRMVREEKDFVYDTESTGLDWRHNAPIGYVVSELKPKGAPCTSVYVPVRHGGGGNLMGGKPMEKPDGEWQIHEFEKQLAKAFDERNRTKTMGRVIGHYIKFDAHFSFNAGISLGRRLADTQDMEAMLNEYAPSFSLADCAERRGLDAKKGEPLYEYLSRLFGVPATKKSMSEYWRLAGNDPIGYDYAVGDGVTTGQLFMDQYKHMSEIGANGEQSLHNVWEMESDLIWTLFRAERRGFPISQDRIGRLIDATEDKIRQDIKFFGDGFNVRSPNDLKSMLEKHGHTDWPTTDKGNPSFTEKWLKTFDVGRKVIAIRKNSNLINSFIRPLVERHVYKGRVHATLNQLKMDDKGTISGRFSCTQPNLQQVPKREKDLAVPFRRLFVPEEGHLVWDYDWSQAEPRLFAHYSGDENLVNGYNSEPFVDAHSVVAELLDVERDPTAKRMNMGIFTGMQPRTFSEHMGWDLTHATVMHKKWFNKFPSIKGFQNKAKLRLRNRGYVMTLLGRRCRLEHPKFAYRGTSKIIQGGQADLMKYKMLEIDRICEQENDIVFLIMSIHDAIEGQRQKTPEAEKLMAEIVRVFEDVQSEPFNLRVPFVAEGGEGEDWAIATWGQKKVDEVLAK